MEKERSSGYNFNYMHILKLDGRKENFNQNGTKNKGTRPWWRT
jgi:hypothetical protein